MIFASPVIFIYFNKFFPDFLVILPYNFSFFGYFSVLHALSLLFDYLKIN